MPLNAQHVASAQGGFEPQRTYAFDVEFYGVPGAENIRLAVVSHFFPVHSNSVINIPYFSEDRKVAGRATYRGGAITCVDYVDEGILNSFYEWRKIVHDPTKSGPQGRASQYKKEASLGLLAPDGGSRRSIRLKGAWPTEVNGTSPNYAQSGYVQISMTIEFDTLEPQV